MYIENFVITVHMRLLDLVKFYFLHCHFLQNSSACVVENADYIPVSMVIIDFVLQIVIYLIIANSA